jgi:hypothetical protein
MSKLGVILKRPVGSDIGPLIAAMFMVSWEIFSASRVQDHD